MKPTHLSARAACKLLGVDKGFLNRNRNGLNIKTIPYTSKASGETVYFLYEVAELKKAIPDIKKWKEQVSTYSTEKLKARGKSSSSTHLQTNKIKKKNPCGIYNCNSTTCEIFRCRNNRNLDEPVLLKERIYALLKVLKKG